MDEDQDFGSPGDEDGTMGFPNEEADEDVITPTLSPDADQDSDISVQRSGWLKKKGGGTTTFSRKNWKSRWFVLSDRRLVYSEMVGSPILGCINVEDIVAVEEARTQKTEFGFAVHTCKRTYYCVSATEEDRKLWILSLRKARAAFAKPIDEGGKSDFMVY